MPQHRDPTRPPVPAAVWLCGQAGTDPGSVRGELLRAAFAAYAPPGAVVAITPPDRSLDLVVAAGGCRPTALPRSGRRGRRLHLVVHLPRGRAALRPAVDVLRLAAPALTDGGVVALALPGATPGLLPRLVVDAASVGLTYLQHVVAITATVAEGDIAATPTRRRPCHVDVAVFRSVGGGR